MGHLFIASVIGTHPIAAAPRAALRLLPDSVATSGPPLPITPSDNIELLALDPAHLLSPIVSGQRHPCRLAAPPSQPASAAGLP